MPTPCTGRGRNSFKGSLPWSPGKLKQVKKNKGRTDPMQSTSYPFGSEGGGGPAQGPPRIFARRGNTSSRCGKSPRRTRCTALRRTGISRLPAQHGSSLLGGFPTENQWLLLLIVWKPSVNCNFGMENSSAQSGNPLCRLSREAVHGSKPRGSPCFSLTKRAFGLCCACSSWEADVKQGLSAFLCSRVEVKLSLFS